MRDSHRHSILSPSAILPGIFRLSLGAAIGPLLEAGADGRLHSTRALAPDRLATTIGRTTSSAVARANTTQDSTLAALAAVVARLPSLALLADGNGTVCAASERVAALLQSPPDALAGRPLRDALASLAGLAYGPLTPDLRSLCEGSADCELEIELAPATPADHSRTLRLAAFGIDDGLGKQYRIVLAVEPPEDRPADADTPTPAALAQSLHQGLQPSLANLKSAALSLHAGSRRWEPAAQQEMLRVIQHEADAIYEALAAYDELVALQALRKQLQHRPIELSDVLMGLLAEWKPAAPAHAFELAMPGEVPLLSADEERIALALNLLLEHAVRLTPGGDTIRVDIRPGPDGVTVSIHHHGYAPTPDEITHLFKPFWRLRGAPEAQVRGGMGLALVAAIVAAHGGRTWAETREGYPGAAVALTLPYAPPHCEPPQRDVATPTTANPHSTPPPLAARKARQCVLVVESDVRMLRYLRANLDGDTYRASVASSVAEAQTALDRDDPDVILLDAQLPGEDLLATLRKLREDTGAPIIVLARRHDPAQCAEALDLGATDYLAKPFSMDELLARVRVALRQRDAALRAVSREPVFESGGLVIDFEQRSVSVDGKPASLSKTEFKLLRTLAQHRNMVLSHELLLERVWGPAYSQEVEFVWVYVRRLRRKIEPDPSAPRYIITVPGVGYRLAGG